MKLHTFSLIDFFDIDKIDSNSSEFGYNEVRQFAVKFIQILYSLSFSKIQKLFIYIPLFMSKVKKGENYDIIFDIIDSIYKALR